MINANINPAAPTYSRYVSDQTRGQMFPRVAGVLLSTGIGAGIGAACGATQGGLGAGPGAGIGAAVGLGIGVATVLAIDATEYLAYKSTITADASETLADIFLNSDGVGTRCPISFTTMFNIPAMLDTCDETFERDELKKWVSVNGTCPVTRIPVKLCQIREDFTVYGKMIKKTTELLNNKEITSKLTEKQLQGFVLYKQHAEKRLKDYETQEFQTIMNKAKEEKIDYLEASKRLIILHNAKNGTIEHK